MSLLSFFGGAAKGFTESVEKEEERAREDAKGAITALYQNYKTVTEENRKLQNTLNEDRQLFEATFGKAEKDQLEAILYNRPVAEMIRKGIESGKINKDTFDLGQFVTVAKSNPDMAAKTERTQQLIDLPETVQKIRAQYEGQPGGLRGFIKSFGEKEYAAAEQAFANRTGKTLEELKSAKRLDLQAPAGTTYNMGMFSTQGIDDIKNKTKLDMFKAREAGDENKLQQAAIKMANIILTEESITTKNKTEQQIQSDLITKIQEAKDPKEKTVLTAQLRQRQQLAKLPGEGKTDADKLTANNLMTAASRAVTSAVSDRLPPGSFMIAVDPNTGAQTLTLKELGQAEQYKKGMEAGRTAAIQQMTDPQTRKPLSDLHKNALFSIGVAFDQQGRAVLPTVEAPAPAGAPPAATPAPSASAAATPTKQLKYNPKTGKWE